MEICAYVADWNRLSAEMRHKPAISDTDLLFRMMEAGCDWISRHTALESDTSASYNSAIGEVFVELIDGDALPRPLARALGTYLVAFCPQVTELEGYAPPKDLKLPEVFYASIGPESLRSLLATYREIDMARLGAAVASLLDRQPGGDIASAEEFIEYLRSWRNAMDEALKRGQGLLVFCG